MTYRSKFEKRIAQQLDDAGVSYGYESYEFAYQIKVLHSKCDDCGSANISNYKWYTPDFIITDKLIIEAKGKFSAADRKKMQSIKNLYPDIDWRIVFMRDNKIHRRSKTRYSDWSKANKYTYAIGRIPDKWLKEFRK